MNKAKINKRNTLLGILFLIHQNFIQISYVFGVWWSVYHFTMEKVKTKKTIENSDLLNDSRECSKLIDDDRDDLPFCVSNLMESE